MTTNLLHLMSKKTASRILWSLLFVLLFVTWRHPTLTVDRMTWLSPMLIILSFAGMFLDLIRLREKKAPRFWKEISLMVDTRGD